MNHNHLVDSCIFTQPIASGNTNGGVTCVQMGDALPGITDYTNVVSNNQFINLNYPTYSDLGYAQCCSCPVAENNTASGVDDSLVCRTGELGVGRHQHFHGIQPDGAGDGQYGDQFRSGCFCPDASQWDFWQPERAE